MANTGNCTCSFNVDFSTSDGCFDNLCLDGGVESCAVVVCLDNVDSIVKTDCDSADPDSGQITAIAMQSGERAVNFFARDNSMSATSNEVFNVDTNIKEITETITGQALIGAAQLCWLRAYLGRSTMAFQLTKCGEVMVFGHDGGLKLTDFTVETGAQKGDFRGVNFNFNNTQNEGFAYVDIANVTVNGTGGFTTGQEFMDALVVAAP